MLPMALYCVYPSAVYLLPLPAASSVSTGAHRRTGCNLPLPARMPLELYGRSHALGSIGRREMSKLSLEVIIFKRLDNKIIWRWEFVIHIIIKEERGTIIIIWRGKRERESTSSMLSLFCLMCLLLCGLAFHQGGNVPWWPFFLSPVSFVFLRSLPFSFDMALTSDMSCQSIPLHIIILTISLSECLIFSRFHGCVNQIWRSWRVEEWVIQAMEGSLHPQMKRWVTGSYALRMLRPKTRFVYRTNWCFFVNN